MDKFKEELENLTRETFRKCKEKVDVKDICGFALYSDNSAMSLSVSLNLIDHLRELQEDDEGFDIYFKWTPGEWKYEMINAKAFEGINNQLKQLQIDLEGNEFILNRNKVYNLAVAVLEKLRKENLFRRTHQDFVLTFAVSDFSEPELEKEWVSRLNPDPLSEEFSTWIDAEEDD